MHIKCTKVYYERNTIQCLNILSYTYVHLLVLATVCNCSMHIYG